MDLPQQQPVHVTMETTTTQKREGENENEGEEQPAKQKLRIGDIELEDEEDWLKANDVLQTGEKIQLKILCPNANEHNLLGQEILLEFDSLSESVLSIKQKLKPLLLNLAQGKMKLEIKKMGFLKDQNSLAFYNVPKTGQAIHLSLKKRWFGWSLRALFIYSISSSYRVSVICFFVHVFLYQSSL